MKNQGPPSVRRLLEAVAAGELPVEEALRDMSVLEVAKVGDFARLDLDRGPRKGVPEVVYAPPKTVSAFAAVAARFLQERGVLLASRVDAEKEEAAREAVDSSGQLRADDLEWLYDEETGILEVTAPAYALPGPAGAGGAAGIITAGTSDVPVAEEAALVLRHTACRVERAYDVGVSGVHRLLDPLTEMVKSQVDVLIVVAGMEGALPSVVAGLVDLPVIGVPTSTGYGYGGDGTGALSSILQSCSPGLVAVNIDNGIGAGAAAALVARRRPSFSP